MSLARHHTDAASIRSMRLQVRTQLGDTSTDTANQRWSDAEIDQALADQQKFMFAKLSIQPDAYTTSETINYDADLESSLLPPQASVNPILKVEDITDPATPIVMRRVDFWDVETWGDSSFHGWLNRPHYVWSLANDSIVVRPKPDAAKTFRIWSIANPITHVLREDSSGAPVVGNVTDTHAYPVMFEELIILGAVKRLGRIDEETPVQILQDYEELKEEFLIYAQRYRGPNIVRSRRRWR